MSDLRLQQLESWLKDYAGLEGFRISVASADASFRRYFRVHLGERTLIAMDAPPDKEDCRPFVRIAKALSAVGLHVPDILCEDLGHGFLLLSDLGDVQYAQVLNADTVESLYGDAMDALFHLQTEPKPVLELPPYDHALLLREMDLFKDWFLGTHLGITLTDQQAGELAKICELLSKSALNQPQVWVHRDYHSRNLMKLDDNNPGVLDFQDAVVGAATYDLVSLLRDCYVAWPRSQVEAWVDAYRQRLNQAGLTANVDQATFQRWFDWMGVQRHMKATGIFARLNHRDGKAGYLKDIPRTLGYVLQVSEDYDELRPLYDLLTQVVAQRYDLTTGQLR